MLGRRPAAIHTQLVDRQHLELELAELLAEEDVAHLAEAMEPGTTAAVLIWENRPGGQLVASGRIPTQALLAAVEG